MSSDASGDSTCWVFGDVCGPVDQSGMPAGPKIVRLANSRSNLRKVAGSNPARSTIFIDCSSRVLTTFDPNYSDLRRGVFRGREIS